MIGPVARLIVIGGGPGAWNSFLFLSLSFSFAWVCVGVWACVGCDRDPSAEQCCFGFCPLSFVGLPHREADPIRFRFRFVAHDNSTVDFFRGRPGTVRVRADWNADRIGVALEKKPTQSPGAE